MCTGFNGLSVACRLLNSLGMFHLLWMKGIFPLIKETCFCWMYNFSGNTVPLNAMEVVTSRSWCLEINKQYYFLSPQLSAILYWYLINLKNSIKVGQATFFLKKKPETWASQTFYSILTVHTLCICEETLMYIKRCSLILQWADGEERTQQYECTSRSLMESALHIQNELRCTRFWPIINPEQNHSDLDGFKTRPQSEWGFSKAVWIQIQTFLKILWAKWKLEKDSLFSAIGFLPRLSPWRK